MAAYSPTVATPPLAESQVQLRQQIDLLTDFWAACSEPELSASPGPGRWSRKEILGHLIDSALNNHRRIVGASLAPPPHRLRPYDQDAWVQVSHYQTLPSTDLLQLWTAYNRLLRHMLAVVSETALARECFVFNNSPVTLDWLIDDYVLHLEHHVQQIIHEND